MKGEHRSTTKTSKWAESKGFSVINTLQIRLNELIVRALNTICSVVSLDFCRVIQYVCGIIVILLSLFSNTCNVIFFFFFNFVSRFQLDLSFPHLAYGIDGVAGSWYFLLVALISLTADISQSKKDRTFWISFVPFAVSIMATVINVAAGYLKKSYDSFEATAFLCTLMLLAFTCPLHFLLETLQRDRSVKGFNSLSHSRKIFGFYFLDENLRRRAMFCLCLLLFVVGVGSDLNLGSLDSLCQVHYPFCWESTQIGDYSAVRLAGSNFCLVMLFTARQMCVSVEYTDMFGVLFQGGALVSEAFIQVSWQFYLGQSSLTLLCYASMCIFRYLMSPLTCFAVTAE